MQCTLTAFVVGAERSSVCSTGGGCESRVAPAVHRRHVFCSHRHVCVHVVLGGLPDALNGDSVSVSSSTPWTAVSIAEDFGYRSWPPTLLGTRSCPGPDRHRVMAELFSYPTLVVSPAHHVSAATVLVCRFPVKQRHCLCFCVLFGPAQHTHAVFARISDHG